METISKLSFWLLTAVLYLSVIVNGFTDAIRSVTYPDIKEQMDFPYTQYGMLQSLGQFSYLLWAFAATFSMPYIGFKATFSISLVITIIGNITTIFAPNFVWMMVVQLLATCATGVLDNGPSSFAVVLFTKHTAVLFCIMSATYGLGAFVAPVFARLIQRLIEGAGYKQIYLWMNVPLLVILIFILCVPFAIKKPQSTTNNNSSVWRYLKSPLVWYLAIMLNLMATAERGTLNWGTLYVKDVLHLDEALGANLCSQFYLIFMIARSLGGFITDWIGPFWMEYIIMPLGIVVYVVGFVMQNRYSLYVLPFTGLFVSLYWPTGVVSFTSYWGEDSGIPVSCILPLQSVVGILIQYLLGVMNDKWGPQYAYWMSVPAAVISLLMFIGFDIICRRKKAREEKEALLNNQDVVLSVCLKYKCLECHN